MLPGDTQQLRHRLIPPVIQREPLQRPRRRTIAQPLHGLPRLYRVHSFQALNVPRPAGLTARARPKARPGRRAANLCAAATRPTTVDSRPTRMACLRKRSPLTDADSSHPEDHSPVSSRCLVTWGKPPLEGGWMPHFLRCMHVCSVGFISPDLIPRNGSQAISRKPTAPCTKTKMTTVLRRRSDRAIF